MFAFLFDKMPYNVASILSELILSFILGVIQGITEFLPISSTAHLLIFSEYITKGVLPLTTSNIIQFGTFIAILQYFWEDISKLFKHLIKIIKSKNLKIDFVNNIKTWINDPNQIFDLLAKNDILLFQLSIATIPVVVTALLTRNFLENSRNNLYLVAIFLTLGGVLIIYGELMHIKKIPLKKSKQMTLKETIIIGLFQSLSVFPGISRSGSALAGGLFLGRDRQESVRFSFLLSIPALGLASLYDLIKGVMEIKNGNIPFLPSNVALNNLEKGSQINLSLISIIASAVVAYLIGLLCLKFLLRYLAKNNSKVFIFYRIFLCFFIILTYSKL